MHGGSVYSWPEILKLPFYQKISLYILAKQKVTLFFYLELVFRCLETVRFMDNQKVQVVE